VQLFKVYNFSTKRFLEVCKGVACERRRISGCRFSPPKIIFSGEKRQPEIHLRSQASKEGDLAKK